MEFTLESLEALAAQVVTHDRATKQKLARMIRAYARIIAVREPEKFVRRATIYADEDGHYDNSYPPKQKWKKRTGPATLVVTTVDFSTRATSDGFYHDTEYFTEEPGISVDADGDLVASTLTGTGSFGQFAAHPGECNVQCEVEFETVSADDVDISILKNAEEKLRAIAFPLVAASEAVAAGK